MADQLVGFMQGKTPEQKAQKVLARISDDSAAGEVQSVLAANPPTGQWIVYAFAILAAGTVGAYYVWRYVKPADFMPSSNYATYAGLFIMALVIERILEPFSGLFIPTVKLQKAASRATAARAKRAQVAAATTGARPAAGAVAVAQAQKDAAVAQKDAAVAQTAFHRAQGTRAVVMWATASVLAMLVCASLGIFLLRSAEAPSPAQTTTASSAPSPARNPNRMLDLLVTGLVVGTGTKPLHDLISQIQTASGSSKAKASSGAAAG